MKKYMIESYRENSEELMKKLHKAKMAICEVMEMLEEEDKYEERNNYRNYRMKYNDRYDY